MKRTDRKNIKGLFPVAAPGGIKKDYQWPSGCRFYIASVDERFDEIGYILERLKDAGRQDAGHKCR